MGLQDRDYMRERRDSSMSNAFGRWWRESSMTEILTVGILGLTLLSSAVWFARDLNFSFGSREGTLRVNINSATIDELETLPGIGPSKAQLIVAGRPYGSVDDLMRVSGIGPATLEGLRPYVKTAGETEKMRSR